MSTLEVSGLRVVRDGREVVTDVELTVGAGEWVGLIGPNGAGKTSLLHAVAGLLPSDGRVLVAGDDLAGLDRREVARRIALVPQRPQPPPGMSVTDYVLLGRTPHMGYLAGGSAHDLDVVDTVVRRLELHGFGPRPVTHLSGGELQRVVLARALAQQPSLLLLDEPTSALDIGHQLAVLELVDGLRRTDGLAVLSAMHDLTLAGQFADRLALLVDGRIDATGTPAEVLTEGLLRDRYGAEVRVLREPEGAVVVVPTRRMPAAAVADVGKGPAVGARRGVDH